MTTARTDHDAEAVELFARRLVALAGLGWEPAP